MLRNLATSLVLFETVDTTEAKAKEVKTFLDIILARNMGTELVNRRALLATFFDRNAVEKIINELTPRYAGRKSGYIRSFHLKNRLGDNAPMMRLELVDKKVFVGEEKTVATSVKTKADKKEEKADKKSEATVTVKPKGEKKTEKK